MSPRARFRAMNRLMSFQTDAGPPRDPWNLPSPTGLALSAAFPMAGALLANGLIFLTGWDGGTGQGAYESLAFDPPGWLVGLVWVIIFPMWGAARWTSRQTGSTAGVRAAVWITVLILWGLAYPLMVLAGGVAWSATLNTASLLLALYATVMAGRASRRAGAWMAPSLAWLAFATFLGWSAFAASLGQG